MTATQKRARTKDLYLRRTYHITLETYNAIRRFQNYRCAHCLRHESEFKNALAVDHDHKSGNIRGLLCATCNRALGKYRDHTENLQRAAAYVVLPPIERMLGRKIVTVPGRIGTKIRAKLLKKFNGTVT